MSTTIETKKGHKGYKGILIAMPWVLFLQFMQVFNDNVFSLITPSIGEHFTISPATVSWVVTIGGVILGVGAAVYATLSDMISIRKLFVFGTIAFVMGSLLGFFVHSSFYLVVIARAVQCAGAAVIPGCFIVLVTRFVPLEKQPVYLGYGTAMYQLAAGLGHAIGGYVTDILSWQHSFLLPIVVLLTIPIFMKYLPDEKGRDGKIDILGTILLIVLATLAIFAVTERNLMIGGLAVALLVIFIFYILKKSNAIVDPSVFKLKNYSLFLMIGILIYAVQGSMFFIFPFLMRDVYGAGISLIGLMFIPANFTSFASGMLAGKITQKIGKTKALYLGSGIVISGLLMFAIFLGSNIIYMWIALLLFGVGYTIIYPGFYTSFTNTLPQDRVGLGMGVYNLVTKVIISLFTAVVGLLISISSLDVKILPLPKVGSNASLYSNVIIFLIIVLTIGVILFKMINTNKVQATVTIK